jgi:hypothetical protein
MPMRSEFAEIIRFDTNFRANGLERSLRDISSLTFREEKDRGLYTGDCAIGV